MRGGELNTTLWGVKTQALSLLILFLCELSLGFILFQMISFKVHYFEEDFSPDSLAIRDNVVPLFQDKAQTRSCNWWYV